jgi:glutamyl-tRNA reductase
MTQSKRVEAIDHARRIIRDHVDRYLSWHRAREMGPIIDRLYQRHHELARAEVERIASKMPSLSAADRTQLEELARRIVNKVLHDPVTQLRDAESGHAGGGASTYLHALEKLFQLDAPQSPAEPRDDAPETPV